MCCQACVMATSLAFPLFPGPHFYHEAVLAHFSTIHDLQCFQRFNQGMLERIPPMIPIHYWYSDFVAIFFQSHIKRLLPLSFHNWNCQIWNILKIDLYIPQLLKNEAMIFILVFWFSFGRLFTPAGTLFHTCCEIKYFISHLQWNKVGFIFHACHMKSVS